MRASMQKEGKNLHISGAEKIIGTSAIKDTCSALIERGMHHDKGEADFLNIKIQEINESDIEYIDALKTETVEVDDWHKGQNEVRAFLEEIGVSEPFRILELFSETYNMRGAMLLDVDKLLRLEPDRERGIRVTNMDMERKGCSGITEYKNHYEEAIVLASKVAACPGIIGEICISDDPDYVTGYVSSPQVGYRRITKMKEKGSECGGRIFLFRGSPKEAEQAIDFLQNKTVIVRNVCSNKEVTASNMAERIRNDLQYRINNSLYRKQKTIDSSQSAHVTVGGKEYVMLASNDYLDIACHPAVKKAVKDAVDTYGFGSGGSRLTTGNTSMHEKLEEKIAAFKETDKAIVFDSGYVANVSVLQSLCHKGDVIFSDELNHASIIDGCRLSKAKVITYAHNDMNDLRKKIGDNAHDFGLVVSDAVFSMDGDILNYPEFLNICEENGLISMIDEAHSTGVIGERGKGIKEYWNEKRNADIMMGTLSKAVGGEGGYVAASRLMIDYLMNNARGYIFSTSLSPAVMAGNLAGLNVIESETWRVKKLRENVRIFCDELRRYGICADSQTAIVPIIVGDEQKALKLSETLFENGFYVSAIRYPTVAKNMARLRVAIMATHTEEELRKCAEILAVGLKKIEEMPI